MHDAPAADALKKKQAGEATIAASNPVRSEPSSGLPID
jgi:hypothetical protein